MSDALSLLLAQKDVVLADGAMGTSLFQFGMDNRSSGELWNVENPDLVAIVHQGFVDAGSDILLTNT
ncbi:MAG: homocysteine S-methyltransferase family protein, partial [Burkholderiales bacterium]|nr:homocysteine S-methyltransferase family protein [Burkholderiales bacterium]